MLSYCGELVRKHDPDRFFMSLMQPADRREALWALYAFNYEIAKTREVVTDTTLGLIRLQWWRDGIAEIYDGKDVRQNEILPLLAQAIQDYDLPQKLFEDLCYAREFDLEGVIPADMAGLLNYASFTSVPLNALALKILGQGEDEALEAVSQSYALIGLVKSLPFHASQQRCYMPADLLAAQEIPERAVYEFKAQEALQPVLKAVVLQAEALIKGRNPSSKWLKLHRKAALMACKQLRSCDYDVFSNKAIDKPAFFHLRLFLTF